MKADCTVIMYTHTGMLPCSQGNNNDIDEEEQGLVFLEEDETQQHANLRSWRYQSFELAADDEKRLGIGRCGACGSHERLPALCPFD
jgi:hypothetical protein